MKLLTKYTDYAMRALVFMAKDNRQLFTVSDLSRKLKISKPFLRMILQKLGKRDILISYKGKNGGFKLASPAKNIFITDLIKIFQGPIKIDTCFIKKRLCPNSKTCPMDKELKDIGAYINKRFETLTIKKLIDSEE